MRDILIHATKQVAYFSISLFENFEGARTSSQISVLRNEPDINTILALRKNQSRYCTILSLAAQSSSSPLKMYAVYKLQQISKEMGLQMLRNVNASYATFNIDASRDEECYRQFQFLKKYLPNIGSIIVWSGCTERNRYNCEQLTAAIVLFGRFAYHCQ